MTINQRIDRHGRLIWLAIIVLIVAATILKVAVAASPTWLHYDENYYLNLSQNFADRGQLTHHMWRMGDITNVIAGAGPGYASLLLVGWMKLIGVSLFNGRVLMIVVGLLTATVMYFVGQKWWRSQAAGVVALVFALVSTSPFYSLVFRMDALGMLAYSLVLLLHLHTIEKRSNWLYFATGVALVVSVEFHIQGIPYIIALTVWYALEYIGELRAKRKLVLNTGFVYYALGGLIAGIIYMIIHILPNPAAYFAIPSQCTQCGTNAFYEVLRYGRFMLLRPVEFLLLFVTLITAAYRRRPEDRHIIILLVTWLAAQFLLGTSPFTHYTYHMWPLLAVGTAGFITRGLRPTGQLMAWRVRLGVLLIVASLLFNIGSHLAEFQPFELRKPIDETAAVSLVRAVVPHDTVIMAEVGQFYYLMEFHDFMSYRDSDQYWVDLRGETMLDYWRREQPLVIIGEFEDDPELDQYMEEMDFVQIRPDLWMVNDLRKELNQPINAAFSTQAVESVSAS